MSGSAVALAPVSAAVYAAKGAGPNPFGIAAIGVAVLVLIILIVALRR